MRRFSCLMATRDRRQFVPDALRCFLDQNYQERELVIVDDGKDPIADLIPDDPRIRYYRSEEELDLQHKREATFQAARGEYFAIWDDDDWHGPQRLERQAAQLDAGAGACMLDPILFYDVEKQHVWQWAMRRPGSFCVGTMAFTRRYYDLVPGGFPPYTNTYSDQMFVRQRPWAEVAYADGRDQYIAVRHGKNSTGCDFMQVDPPWRRAQDALASVRAAVGY